MHLNKRFLGTTLLKTENEFELVFSSFSRLQWVVFSIFFIVFVLSVFFLLQKLNEKFLVSTPTYGGELSEGIIGTPRFINPILALSDADKDITTLVYSGLMRKTPYGELIPDLAESYDIREDGLVYTFNIREDAEFHDGSKVTAQDVAFTINKIKDPMIKSPKKVNWDGVTVTTEENNKVIFTLKQRYASFINNTTIGILPEKLWKDLTPEQFGLSDLNISGIGSGPFKINKVNRSANGIPGSYEFSSFKDFTLGRPYLDRVRIVFFGNENDLITAFKGGKIDSINAISPESTESIKAENVSMVTTTLPRVFGLFFNQNKNPIFIDKNIIRAINKAIDKEQVVNDVLKGYGKTINGPIPPLLLETTELGSATPNLQNGNLKEAEDLILKSGWKKNDEGLWEKIIDTKKKTKSTLSFSISTSDTPELKKAANIIKDRLAEIGIPVELKIFDIGSLNQNVIRPRDYEALFFGQVVNNESDLFAFWHSSQRNDPGLNIAIYTNAKADKYLEDAISQSDEEKRIKSYLAFSREVINDSPAVFVYSPAFIYATRKNLQNIILYRMTNPSDRFIAVHTWFKNTEKVWDVFTK
jgi:peptide/nickel transport system substrate-binding protein